MTEAALGAKEAGLIEYRRGLVRILDREGLAARSCECYERTKAEYERLFTGEINPHPRLTDPSRPVRVQQ